MAWAPGRTVDSALYTPPRLLLPVDPLSAPPALTRQPGARAASHPLPTASEAWASHRPVPALAAFGLSRVHPYGRAWVPPCSAAASRSTGNTSTCWAYQTPHGPLTVAQPHLRTQQSSETGAAPPRSAPQRSLWRFLSRTQEGEGRDLQSSGLQGFL